MIALEGVSARRGRVSIRNVTLDWDSGIHAVMGTAADGCRLLLAVMVGAAKVATGTVRVLGGAPTDAAIRTRIARVGLDPSLPDVLSVNEVLELASALRGEAPRAAEDRLAVLGLESLARRSVVSLSRAEARGVALVEAVTSSRVTVVVVEEPLVLVDPRAASRIVQELRRKGQDGCAIVVTTASLRDARTIADDCSFMQGGALVQSESVARRPSPAVSGAAQLAVVLKSEHDATQLVAALAGEHEVAGVAVDAHTLKVLGGDPAALARAAGHALAEAGVDVLAMEAP